MEKIYVAVGNDVQEGLATLEWTLRKWSSTQISIVIIHADVNKDYYGKLPASYVNDESFDFLKKSEQGKQNKILHQYISFCGKEKTETLNIEKYDEPIDKRILQLISGLRICKLVIGITFLKSSSLKYGSVLNGLKSIQRKKPDFCDLYLTSGGKLFFLKEENNEGFIEDEQGEMIAKLNKKRGSFKDEESVSVQVSHDTLEISRSTEPDILKNLNPIQKTELLRIEIGEARDAIHLKRREAKVSAIKYSKAEWAISLCTSRARDLEARLNEETMKRGDIEKDLKTVTEELTENRIRLEQNKSKLNSTVEIQRELSNKHKSSTLKRSQSEEQLRWMIHKRGGMIQEIENLRKQKDVMHRRIEFCKNKNAIEMATRLNDLSFSYKEFTAGEIRAGTENFSEQCRIKCLGDLTNVYRGQINHTTVVVKLYDFGIKQISQEEFDNKVKVLGGIQHPHLVAMLGFCTELKCTVFEYMHQSCLKTVLLSNSRKKQVLNWHARVSIEAEVCTGLTFLHLTKPTPMVHGNLNLANILLDRNNVAKLHRFRLDFAYNESDIRSDIQNFGILVLELLHQWDVEWPEEVRTELKKIAIRCSYTHSEECAYTGMTMVMKEMEEVKKKADDVAADVGRFMHEFGVDSDDQTTKPSFFFCPILQDIMKDPHVAADGFLYELSAINQWIEMGHNTSPMTNLDLQHKHLTPNHTLRCLIQDWHNKKPNHLL